MNTKLLLAIFSLAVILHSCTTETKTENTQPAVEPSAESAVAQQPAADAALQIQPEAAPQVSATQPSPSVASAGSVFHYICPNKCAGGGSEGQGKCPVCNTDLVHNDAFHNQQQPQVNMQPQTNAVQLNTGNQNQQPQQTPPAESPQNAKGVWHYTCPKGCAGGAGQAIACSNCGTQMEHNQKYHE